MTVPSAHAGADDGARARPREASLCVEAMARGEAGAETRLSALLYGELRQLARAFLREERADHTLQATALVHEAWMRLIGQERVSWQGRQHFFAVAAMAMRRVLVDHARARQAERRGGGATHEPLASGLVDPEQGEELLARIDLLALDEGLLRLEEHSTRAARIVELRFFGGLSEKDTAATLGLAPSTVTLEWKAAREADPEVRALVADMLAGVRVGKDAPRLALETGMPGLGGLVAAALDAESGGLEASERADARLELADGPYRVLGVLARGGMGVVLRARDEEIGRNVALKVLRPDAGTGARLRFIEEAQVAGQLEHPGIVPIYHLGADEAGRPFFAMKLVEGETLAEQLARRVDPAAERARFLALFLQVCQTVAVPRHGSAP